MARSSTHTGWWRDSQNGRLYFYYEGTEVGYIDDSGDATGFTLANGITVTAGGMTITAGGVAVTGTSTMADKFTYSDQMIHANADVETITANKTLDVQDTGKVMESALNNVVFALPATVVGICYQIVNTAADAGAKLSISPNTVDKIMGPDLAGEDNKDLVNTQSTQKKGDYVKILGDGSSGWYVQEIHGTWAQQT